MTTTPAIGQTETHFLDKTSEEKAAMRLIKIVNGYLIIGLCLAPDVPLINHIALFAIVDKKPVFLDYAYQETFEDDGWLSKIVNEHFPC